MGLASLLVDAIRESGTTDLLVEQNARQTLKISDEAIVLSHGRIFRVGKRSELLLDPAAIEAFLGETRDDRGEGTECRYVPLQATLSPPATRFSLIVRNGYRASPPGFAEWPDRL
jgi:ABC-type sulfate/molybdate transport systems ATPase subunit